MKTIRTSLLIISLFFITSCVSGSSMKPEDFKNTKPTMVIEQYFQHNGIIQRPKAVYQRVRYFCKDRFLYRYPGNDMMLYALNVLNQKVGQSVISERDEALLLETIIRTDALLEADELSIFNELRSHA